MIVRPLLLAATLGLATVGSLAAPAASARVLVGLNVNLAPPPPRVEHVVVRPGYAWVPGYWRWNGRTHVWVGGYYVRARPGYAYRPARWEHVGPRWRFHAGYWARH